jgi:HPt (histidine-containing phosphotransfer) domain-containing protein
MFLEKGFNDYLSKPIELSKLDEIMGKWIPAEKKLKEESPLPGILGGGSTEGDIRAALSLPPIEGVDMLRGLTMTGGTEEGYRKVLHQFSRDLRERRSVFSEVPEEEDMAFFATQAHALKSAAGTIGAVEIAAEAAQLEAAGKAGDREALREILPAFYEGIGVLAKGIAAALSGTRGAEAGSGGAGKDPLRYRAELEKLREALETKNIKELDRILGELEEGAEDGETRGILADISDQVLMSEYPGALDLVHKLYEKNNPEIRGA